jgi:superfamily I DNA/RNA helicase
MTGTPQAEAQTKDHTEERRVFYVGMTRAKNKLNIVVPGEPSLFVNELIEANKKKQ